MNWLTEIDMLMLMLMIKDTIKVDKGRSGRISVKINGHV